MEAKYQDELKVFKNIWRSRLHRVVAHATVFPCVDAISWILNHVDLDNWYILNAKGGTHSIIPGNIHSLVLPFGKRNPITRR
jgi:hypothetical protein